MKLSETITLRDYQEEMVIKTLNAINELESEQAFGEPDSYTIIMKLLMSAGKEQPYSEKILTPNGWTTMGELQKNDFVIGSDGKSKKVLETFEQGEKNVYQLTFLDGTTVKCGYEHLWEIQYFKKNSNKKGCFLTSKVVDFKYLYDKRTNIKNKQFYIRLTKAIEYTNNENEKLPIDPYALGLLLGDGSFRGHKSRIMFSNSKKAIRDCLEENLLGNDKTSNIRTRENSKTIDINILGGETSREIQKLGLNNLKSYEKFIPNIYKKSSIKNRQKLLQGLIDTDGSWINSSLNEYSTSSEQLAYDVVELARGLGIYTTISSRIPKYTYKGEKKTGKKSYRIFLNYNKNKKLITKVEKLNYKEKSKCIMIDSADHLYVTNGYNLTHNTYTALALANELSKRGEKIGIFFPYKILVDQFAESAREANIEIGVISSGTKNPNPEANIQVCMIQTLHSMHRNNKLDIKFSKVIQDEVSSHFESGSVIDLKESLGYNIRIGMTGTDFTSQGYALNAFKTIETIGPKGLVEQKAWHPNMKYNVANFSEKMDWDKIKIESNGEFNQAQLSEIIEADTYIHQVIKSMNSFNMKDDKTIVFTSSIHMAQKITVALNEAGYSAKEYHSKMKKKEREAVLNSFINETEYKDPNNKQIALPGMREQEPEIIKCCVNVQALNVGFNVPDIKNLVLATSMMSRVKHHQTIARLIRYHEIEEKILLDCGSNISRNFFLDDTFTPVNRTEDKQIDKANLARENAKWSLPLLNEFLSDDLTTEISRDWYDSKLDNLRAIENSIFNDNQEEELAQKRVGSSNRDIDPEEVRIKHEQDMAKNMAMVLRTTDDLEHLAKAYIWFWMYVNGSPISKAGHKYVPKIEWFVDKWEADIDKYPEVRNRFMKALKTRAKNIIKEGKNINSLSFFTNFLLTNYENEIQQQEEYKQLQFGLEENNVMDEISEEECPF